MYSREMSKFLTSVAYIYENFIKMTYSITLIRSGDNAQFPLQPPGSLVVWGTEWPKNEYGYMRKSF